MHDDEITELIPQYNSWINNPKINEFMSGLQEPTKRTAERLYSLREKQNSDWTFAIKENGELIGFCGLHNVHAVQGYCELEIFLGSPSVRGKGIGKKVVLCLCNFGFTKLELRGVIVRVVGHNTAAIACYEKCGFVEVYRYPRVHERNGCFHDEVILQLNTT